MLKMSTGCAASYLSYGGVLKVVRTAGTTLQNANAAVGVRFYYHDWYW